MRRLVVLTPALVPLEYRLAGLPERAIAWLLDQLLVFAVLALLTLVVLLVGLLTAGAALAPGIGFVVVATLVVDLGYRAWTEATRRGRTWGKSVVGLRTVQTNGAPLLAWQAVVRNVARPLDQLPVLHLVAAVCVVCDPRARRVGDMLAGTVVIRDVRPTLPRAARTLLAARNSLLEDPAAAARVRSRVSEREATALAEFAAAAPRMDTARRLELAERIARHYRARLALGAHASLPDEALLAGIVGVALQDRFGRPRG